MMKKEENTQTVLQSEFCAGQEFNVKQLTYHFNSSEAFEKKLTDLKTDVAKKNLTHDELLNLGNHRKDEIHRAINTEKHFLENKLFLLESRQGLITNEYIENHYKDITDYEQNRYTVTFNKALRNIPILENKLTGIKEILSSLKSSSGQKADNEIERPYKSMINRKAIYLLLLSIFSLGDALLGYNAMLVLGEGIPNIALAWLTLLTASATGIGAHFSGKILAKNGFTKEFTSAILVSVSFVFILIWIRTDIQGSIVLSALNAAFFAMASLISYHRYLHQDFFDRENLITSLRQKSAALYTKISNILNAVNSDKEAVHFMLHNKAKEQATKDILYNSERVLELKNAMQGMDKIEKGYYQRIDLIVASAQTQHDKRKERAKNGIGFNFASLFRPFQNAFMIAGAMLVLNACTPATETTDIIVLMDVTETHNAFPNANVVLQDIGDFDAGQITLSAITDTHAYPYYVVSLETPKPYFMQVKEEEDSRQNNFKQDFKVAYETINISSEELQYSYVFSAINTHLVTLSKSKATHKHFLCYSDLLQHSANFSFYSYRHNPKQILKDYDAIIAKFEAEYGNIKGTDLRGVNVTVMYTPQKSDDALYYHTSQFWKRFFQDKGATKVRFIPLLPSTAVKMEIAIMDH